MKSRVAMAAVLVMCCGGVQAAVLTWDGSTASWDTPASWGGTIPDLATPVDEAIVNGGNITWTTATDFAQNSSFTMTGGTWTQVGNNNWIDFGIGGKTGVCTFSGSAVFNSGSADNVFLGRGGGIGKVTINGARLVVTNNSGAEVHVQGDGAFLNLNSGTVEVNLISFDGNSNCFVNLSGGELRILKGNVFQGIFRAAGGYVNFATGASASIFIDNLTTNTMGGLLTDGRVQVANVVNPAALIAVDEGTGVRITTISTSPSVSPAGLSGKITNGVFTLTATNLTVNATNMIDRARDLSGNTWTTIYSFTASGTTTNFSEVATNVPAFYRVISIGN